MKTHLELARELYRLNHVIYAWDDLSPQEKAEYIYLAEQTVLMMHDVLGLENTFIKIVEIKTKDLKGGCNCN